MIRRLLIGSLLVAALLVGASYAFAGGGHGLNAVQKATKKYRNVAVAKAAKYGELKDAAGIACIDSPPLGAMGIHYVNGKLVGDAVLNPRKPEAVVYEPQKNGKLKLVAVEYIVFQKAWEDAGNTSLPTLFGKTFMWTPTPNRFGLPAFYSLHAWIFKHNPSGMFAMWNPHVSCANA
jgi:hypothetical protein